MALKKITNGVIGIVNNITTQLALDTGSNIIQGLTVEEIVEKVTANNRSRYKLIKPAGIKKKALITTCITGIGTAIRIKDLILKSFNEYSSKIEVIAYDYFKLKNNGYRDNIFKDFDVVTIIGTKDPKIEEIPFFSLEDIISGQKEAQFRNLLRGFIPEQGIKQINQSLVKFFSLESVLNYITILNPDKIIDQIEMAIEALQYEMKVKFTNDVKICLYIHLSCLIERLVTKTQINEYNDEIMSSFAKLHKDFVDIVKKSFSVIEKLYSVSVPLTEIYFIYEIFSAKIPNMTGNAK
ncbi:PRD domain-containing protein [Biomaibacter acetigenes]|uniref:PRD domain-containing protein n=1 Tax=Biomaibacter acetigenes TaxID=2316383 RepID=UPI001CA45A56|nr:PRD domain-containing protein [Biomaibacter acetigenes]